MTNMKTQIAKIEPIPLPDARRPTLIPSLPEWVASLKNATALSLQKDPETGSFKDVMTLPPSLIPNATQRRAIQSHLDNLRSFLRMTPQHNVEADKATFALVTKMMLAKPAQRTTEAATEATGDAYMAALDDVPCWAVEAAIRLWYRGECGTDNRGKPYNYEWRPEPHALRSIAMQQAAAMAQRIADLEPVLVALPRVDHSAEFERSSFALTGLARWLKGSDHTNPPSFEDFVALGSENEDAVALEQGKRDLKNMEPVSPEQVMPSPVLAGVLKTMVAAE